MNSAVSLQAHVLARRQGGVVTRSQLFELGMPSRTLTRRVADGTWVAFGRNILIAPGTPDSLATRSRIVALQIPRGVLTGPSTAALVGGRVWEGIALGHVPWLINRERNANALYVTHPFVRTRAVGPWRVACTSDAVIDMIRLLPASESRALAYRAMQCRVVSLDELRLSAQRLRGLAGNPQLRTVTTELGLGIRSEGERLLVRLARRSGLVGWVCAHPVTIAGRGYELDMAFLKLRLAVEVDGYAYHSARDRFLNDRRRQNNLVNAGWTVLRFTWEDLTQYPDRTISLIRQKISQLS